ncbi:hypothetical protein [Thermoanaerobacterium sp. RBIITD]|uniref:hypothetical protein n=1 Tax=Thermoanaerobacterium sp. RBIITD TaxID=1550240 RepID=UPI000BB706DE|nr:hypothetical protein [Thermoanaerobacterium sp. RBIITD]SNX55021.1 hypothetical protein SAMN05660242_2803 [Thermoanaerobacterium sp. RBIITD]
MFLIKERIDPYFIEEINVKPIFAKSNLSFYREENMGSIGENIVVDNELTDEEVINLRWRATNHIEKIY